jgi:hypothetical protein
LFFVRRFIQNCSIGRPEKLGVELNDFNCGLKAYKKRGCKKYWSFRRNAPLYSGFGLNGFLKLRKVVIHQARKIRPTKNLNGTFYQWISRFNHDLVFQDSEKRPMHLFGALGSITFNIGFVLSFYLGFDKLFINTSRRLITENRLFLYRPDNDGFRTQLF